MKILLLLTLPFALVATTASAALKVISAEHREEASFKRFSEYLTGKQSEGRYAAFRSDESSRDGFYVSLLSDNKKLLGEVTTVRLNYVLVGTQKTEILDMSTEGISKKRILVGLTGDEWSEPSSHPIAWKIELIGQSGQTIDQAQSFLWAEQ